MEDVVSCMSRVVRKWTNGGREVAGEAAATIVIMCRKKYVQSHERKE